MRSAIAAAVVLALALPAAAPLHAQSAASDTGGVLRREVFSYPGAGRRDPFAPLSAGVGLGPRFEDLELTGVIYSPSVGSVVVLRDRVTFRRYRAREGDRLGEARVLAIRESEAEFLVSGFGVDRRETLRVKRTEQEPG